MNAFWWVVGETYPTWETLTQNFGVIPWTGWNHEQTNEHTNGQTDRRKLYPPRHKCRVYNETYYYMERNLFSLCWLACFKLVRNKNAHSQCFALVWHYFDSTHQNICDSFFLSKSTEHVLMLLFFVYSEHLQIIYLSHNMTKRVFGSFRPGQTQTGLCSHRS